MVDNDYGKQVRLPIPGKPISYAAHNCVPARDGSGIYFSLVTFSNEN